jgi:hypothetical protein
MFETLLNSIGIGFQALQVADDHNIRYSEAKTALLQAFRETKKHIAETRTDYDDIASKKLSKKWSKVAEKIRPFNANTANILEMKADYWISPYEFKREIQDGQRRYDFRMMLVEIEKLIKNLK